MIRRIVSFTGCSATLSVALVIASAGAQAPAPAPEPSAFVHVLGFVAADRFVVQTGVAVGGGVVLTAFPVLSQSGAKGVLDGGIDLERSYRPAAQQRDFPEEGVMALFVPGLTAPYVRIALPDLEGSTDVALVSYPASGERVVSALPEIGMGKLEIVRAADGSATLTAQTAGPFSTASPAGPLVDACGRMVGMVVDDVNGQRRAVASHTLVRLLQRAQVPYEFAAEPCLDAMPGQEGGRWGWLALAVLTTFLMFGVALVLRRRQSRSTATSGSVRKKLRGGATAKTRNISLLVDAGAASGLLEISSLNLSLRDGGATIGSADTSDIRIEHPSVIPRHARVRIRDGALAIVELDGPVTVNGLRLMPATEKVLTDGDRIRLGEADIEVRL